MTTVRTMQTYLLKEIAPITVKGSPLVTREMPRPEPGVEDVLLRVRCCGVCHTELDEIEGRTAPPVLPVIPGHQVVGEVVGCGAKAHRFKVGDRVGVAWIFSACGRCVYCLEGQENLCHDFKATGRDRNGGYAEYMVIPQESAYPIPEMLTDSEAAPLLCGGAIGYRSLRLTTLKDGETLGLMGFGASAHIVLQLAQGLFPNSRVVVFARSEQQRHLALQLGAFWAGDVHDSPPAVPKGIIDTTPAWGPVLASLKMLARGGRLVINAIRKEQRDFHLLQGLCYEQHLWLEKEVKSVANITRSDVQEFLPLAARLKIRPQVTEYPFARANEALVDLKYSRGTGARVLVMNAES